MSAKSVKAASAAQTAEGIVFVKAAQARRWAASGLHSTSCRIRTACDFSQGRLEAGQSKHTRTPPQAAKRLIAAVALWHHARETLPVQGRSRPVASAQSAMRGLSTCRRASGPPESKPWKSKAAAALHQCGLTLRSSGAPTAGHQARSGGTRYIFASPGLASYRCRPLSSNVRPHMP